MPDPRTTLETYAQGISGLGTTEQAAPEAIAALRAVLAIHEPTVRTERPSNVCPECYDAAQCDTVQAIQQALGGDDAQ